MTNLENVTNELESWITTQPYLPQHIDRLLLKRYVYSTNVDINAARKAVKKSFQMRNENEEIFLERDPMSDISQRYFEAAAFVPLPKLTKEGHKVFLWKMLNADKFNYDEALRNMFMAFDVSFITPELNRESQIPDGDIMVFDLQELPLNLWTKISLTYMRMLSEYMHDGHPVKTLGIHFLNVPTIFTYLTPLIGPFIKKDGEKIIHFHKPGSESLFDHVSREIFPNEYGGSAGLMQEIVQDMRSQIEAQRSYLMNSNHWVVKGLNTDGTFDDDKASKSKDN